MKDDYISWADECLEFENGSKIISVDLASISSRGQRANIVLADGKWMKLQTRRYIREAINDLKWYQKLRIEVSFIIEDIMDWISYFRLKLHIRKVDK